VFVEQGYEDIYQIGNLKSGWESFIGRYDVWKYVIISGNCHVVGVNLG
jgi:hypothetical protein